MRIMERLAKFLDDNKIAYEVVHHRRDYTAQETAADTHTPGKDFAKTVIIKVDNQFCMFLLPATAQVDFNKIKRELDTTNVWLAYEDEFADICSDCEIGAMPPFGSLFGMPVYVCSELAADFMITFNAGTHEHAVRMLYKEFERLEKPVVFDFATQELAR